MDRPTNQKEIDRIVGLQQPNGSFGYFHGLSVPTTSSLTTEQAMRRLKILGLTKDDEPTKRVIGYMHDCLKGKIRTIDRREKVLNWDAFESFIMAVWLSIFEVDDSLADPVKDMWKDILKEAFETGEFDENRYNGAYRKHIPVLNKGERLIDATC